MLRGMGFNERIRGSPHMFRKQGQGQGIEEMINLQRDGNHAKGYQVRGVSEV